MPIRPPALDDRTFDDLVAELIARIPAHTPDWTDPRPGDPGRTLIELFAWLGDTLLYRANLIPERQRLAFLRLLDVPLQPARPARTIVTLAVEDKNATNAVTIRPGAKVNGPIPFETLAETTVLPVAAEAFYKRPLEAAEAVALETVLENVRQVYVGNDPKARIAGYVTTALFAGEEPEPAGFDLIRQAVDRTLWLALLAAKPEQVAAVRATLRRRETGGYRLVQIGAAPAFTVPTLDERIGPRAALPHRWEVTGLDGEGRTRYHALDLVDDTTGGLTRPGVQTLAFPDVELGAPSNDVRRLLAAGVGDEPPRLDDPAKAARLVTWLRLRPAQRLESMALSWVAINAVEIDQRETVQARLVGESNGAADQEMKLPGQSVDAASLQLQVAEVGQPWRTWQQVDDINLANRDLPAFTLDAEAGAVRFGDGVRGKIPARGSRVRVTSMRSGGGHAGNVPPGALTSIAAVDLQGRPFGGLTVRQRLAATGGADAETLAQAERRIPDLFRHRERAVTQNDFVTLARQTPGVALGRVDVLPRFKPHQRRDNVPGVISVLVLPQKTVSAPPNPRADRPMLESVHAYLDERRPLGTELYVIQCEYVPVGLAVGVELADGFGREGVLQAVRDELRRFLWPLAPGGLRNSGWPLGRTVEERELELVVARVAGVQSLLGERVVLFAQENGGWQRVKRGGPQQQGEIRLESWQLPELLSVIVVDGDGPPATLSDLPNPFDDDVRTLPVPVVPEVCR